MEFGPENRLAVPCTEVAFENRSALCWAEVGTPLVVSVSRSLIAEKN